MKTRPPPAPVRRPSVIFTPDLLSGVSTIAKAVSPTLGPLARAVGVERNMRNTAPEIMDDAAIIARRIVQIANPTADVGAMMLRQAMWAMHQTVGDGAATTAVLAEAVLAQAVRATAAGVHPVWLRLGIESGVAAACHELRRMMIPMPAGKPGRTLLARLARCLSPDDELTSELVEMVHFVGPDGMVELITGERRTLEREYIEGAVWDSGWFSGAFTTDKGRTIARLEDSAVVLVDDAITSRESALRSLERLMALGVARAVIVAADLSSDALPAFIDAHHRQAIQLALVKAPLFGAERVEALLDLAALTGGRVLPHASLLPSVALEDLGEVSRFWVTEKKFGVIAGARDIERLHERIAAARAEIAHCHNADDLPKLRKRLARLTGGHAILHVGGVTQQAAETRRDHGIRLARVLQSSLRTGIVPGGGAAYLGCQTALEQLARTGRHTGSGARLRHADQAAGVQCVAQALQAPMATLAGNAGYRPSSIVARARAAGEGYGLDARSGRIVRMVERGILDSFQVVERALQTAGSMAALTITTAAVVHHRRPTIAARP